MVGGTHNSKARQLCTDDHPAGCKIAILAIRFLNGSISYDTSRWDQVRAGAHRVNRVCNGGSATHPSGGNLVIGELEAVLESHGLLIYGKVIILGWP